MADYQVVIAGGGPVGLAAAVELGRRGIHVLVIEPRVTVSHARPRCKTVNARSMEHLRRWGLADELRKRAPLSTDWSQDVVFCTSLTGRELSRFSGVLGLVAEGDRFPELGQQAPQYVLEELLRDSVGDLPSCELRTGLAVTDLQQDAAGVTVTATDTHGTSTRVTAEYLIGCDGPRSAVRPLIGAAYDGEHALRPNFGMVFQAPGLSELVPHGPAVHYWVINPDAPALLGPLDREGTWWMIAFGADAETGARDAGQLIDAATGTTTGAVILSTDPWTARMQIADRMRDRRVFLAGDAAHLNPPLGGHGLNTGLGDAVDLGWKLAAVLDGWGGPALLDSYAGERRPIQERVIREATANMAVTSAELLADNLDAADEDGERARLTAGERIQATKRAEFHSLDLVLDIRIEESPVIAHNPSALAGSRLPHAWLDGQSLYDDLGSGFTLLVLADLAASEAVRIGQAAHSRGVPLSTVNLSGHHLRDRYGADLVLVRPDQYVAWADDLAPEPARLIDLLRGECPVATQGATT
ncbi:FAD-dependent monooxygenase [Streptacidiphilus sp. N1-12]|uniref:FAD-dependent monooxygenase n=2 Tax=Streptacidiphilus alkalitolerans TaxID=3342712 RepID=A0ABV6W900_9ACTN